MKKSIFVIAVAVLVMASCNKERTCECTVIDRGVEKKVTRQETGTRSRLKDWCANVEQILVNDTISKAECKLQ